jgi:phosphatidylserine/phosphatidylglycerophosphate/cardiolipin synthase-like enzyme
MRTRILNLWIVLLLVVAACTPTPAPSTPVRSTPAAGGPTAPPPWLNVYFTNPNPPDDVGNSIVDKVVVPAIARAQRTIDVASFDFNLPSVVDGLIAAKKRGVKVRVVYDGQEGETELKQEELVAKTGGQPFEKAEKAGIEMVSGGRSNGLMHNKMIIIDSQVVFVGSWNISYNDTYRNNNNLLEIYNPQIIQNYQAKFNEGFESKRFGAKATLLSPNPKLVINGTPVENYFSPDDEVMQKLVAEVGKAKKSVRFIAFTYTHADLSGAMIAAFQRGVVVEGVIENRGASQGAMPRLFCAKVPVRTDGNKYTMHHKVIIIDDETVVTGSYNFTKSADDSNDDNVIIIRSASLAAVFKAEFDRVYGAGEVPDKVTCS